MASTGYLTKIPGVIVQAIASGGSMSGADPDGTDSSEAIRRGRIRVFGYNHAVGSALCTDGGGIEIASGIGEQGLRIERVVWNLPGVTNVALNIRDRNLVAPATLGVAMRAGNVAAAVGHVEWQRGGVLVPPGFRFEAVATGALTADGAIMFVLADGWAPSSFDAAPILGSESLPG